MSLGSAFSPQVRRRAVVVMTVVLCGMLAVALFFMVVGWFQDARPADPDPVEVGEPFRIGDMEYVVTGARAVDENRGVFLPRDDEGETDPGVRALVVDVEVTNVSDRAWLAVVAGYAVHPPEDGGIVEDDNGELDNAAFYSADEHLVDVLNPGVTVAGTYGWAQDASWDGDEVTLTFTELRWVEDDPLTLDDQHWARTDRAVRTVTVPVDDVTAVAP